MKRAASSTAMIFLASLFGGGGAAPAASLDVDFGQTVVVSNGAVYDDAVVRNGGVLILHGGSFPGACAPRVPSPPACPR